MTVEPANITIGVEDGESLLDAAWRSGYRWPTICYGQAQCTACHVVILSGGQHLRPPSDAEQIVLARLRRLFYRDGREVRLACRLTVTGDVTVEQKRFAGERHGEAR